MTCSVNSEVLCLLGERNKPRIPHSCKLADNVTFKLIETLIIPGGKRGDIHPVEESMVQTSRVDWSPGEHFKPLPLPGTNLKELLLCPPRCRECAPIDLSVTTIATGTLSTNSSSLSNERGRSGMKIWQDPERQLAVKTNSCLALPKISLRSNGSNTRSPEFLLTGDETLLQTSVFWERC